MRHTPVFAVVPLIAIVALAISARDVPPRAATDSDVANSSRAVEDSLSIPVPAGIDSLGTPTAPGSGEPNLTVGANGRVYMTWLEPAATGFALRLATLDGTRWSAPRTIQQGRDFVVNWADFPSVAVMPDGRLVAHWLQRGKSSGAYSVRVVQSRDDGATWSAPVTLHRDSSETEHGFVSLWADGTGASSVASAVWLDGRKYSAGGSHSAPSVGAAGAGAHGAATNEMMVLARSLDAKGTLTAETVIDPRACDCCQTAAAMTSTGPVVAYRDRSSEEIRDISVVRRVAGKWSAPSPVYRDGWKIAACPVNGPSIDARGTRVSLAWFTSANDSARVKLAFSSNGGATWSAPTRVDDGNPAGRVGTRLLPDGSALVTWIERTGGDMASVRARRITATGTRGTAVIVASSSAARASGFPRVATTSTHAIFAWTVPGKPTMVRTARMALAELR
ncbi:MAG TPA: sialidase family protein [Gemmatimonas sp.]|nr:sialidase family protein [Gemmatimonas sp.]